MSPFIIALAAFSLCGALIGITLGIARAFFPPSKF
jgi:amino acid transporter